MGQGSPQQGWQARLDRLATDRPDIALMAPYMAYLILLQLKDIWPGHPEFNFVASLVRGVGALLVVWVLRRHMMPWGRADLWVAIPAGVAAAFGWYYGHKLLLALGIPHPLPLPIFTAGEIVDPTVKLGTGATFWAVAVAHIAVASTTVGVVEEIFWRAFLLRALIDWSNFEKLPLGAFSWRAMILTSLLSTLQHPDHWLISIFCWLGFNALMYWRKSVLCLIIVHGVTNLVLYAWVLVCALAYGDRSAWMFLSLTGQ